MKILKKFMAGKHINEVLADVKQYNKESIACSISYLAVFNKTPEQVEHEVQVYFNVLEAIEKEGLQSDVTVKLQQFGFYSAEQLAEESIRKVVEYAHQKKNFVWIDMERIETIDKTIILASKLNELCPGSVGICLQTYMERTKEDLHKLIKNKIPIRLVKGFYNDQDIKSWREVTENFRALMQELVEHSGRPAIATHDLKILEELKHSLVKQNLKEKVEIQFFKGVCDDLAFALAKEGFKVRMYIPFGNFSRFLIDGFFTFDIWRQSKRLLLKNPTL